MKLCVERLSQDWQAQHGHPLLALESFVDGQLFRGTIYKAANWTLLGATAGYGRVAEDFYVAHERPKQLWVRVLEAQAKEWLSAESLPAELARYQKPIEKRCEFSPDPLASLRERFAEVAEFRKGQGKRHRIPTVLAIAACAKMAGVMGGYAGIASYARNLTRPQRRALHCWYNHRTGQYEVPSESCFLRVLQGVSQMEVEAITLAWQEQVLGPTTLTRWWRSMARLSRPAKCIWWAPLACPPIAAWESSRWLTRATKFPPRRSSLNARRFSLARWSVWTRSIRSTKPWPKSSTTKEL